MSTQPVPKTGAPTDEHHDTEPTVPRKYQPDPRLIDQPEELRRLYVERDLSIQDIADDHAEVGKTRVGEALQEHGIGQDDGTSRWERGRDPPTEPSPTDWSTLAR